MTLIGSGRIGISSGAKEIKLSDKAGVDALTITDSEGFPVIKLDSAGNIRQKGTVKRTTVN